MLPGKKYTPDEYPAHRVAAPVDNRRSRCVVISSTTAVVAFFLPNRYRASTSILIVPQRVPENSSSRR